MGKKDKKMVNKEKKYNTNESLQHPTGSSQDNVNRTTNAQNSQGKNKKKVITDDRFSSANFDPRFQNISKHQSKVSIGSRFKHIITDKRFSSDSTRIDKRGKAKDPNSEGTLRKYYHLEEEKEQKKVRDSKSDDDEEVGEQKKVRDRKIDDDEESGEEIENETLPKFEPPLSDSESESEPELFKPLDDPETDTTSTNSDTDDEDASLDDEPEEPEENIPEIEQETHRLAIVNMDWGQVRAVDLYVVMSSFLPKTGRIVSVAVYPSEFGIKRMEEEAVSGPIGVFDSDEEKIDEDNDNNDEIDQVKLRAYEKSRLRYYYAVVECDSSATADYLYRTCDGTEFERSSNVLDLRFIPDSMEFKHPPRDIATEAPTNYEGLDFHTRALQQSKINLTWDEDEPQRAKTLKRNFNADQLAELEVKEFLASDSDDDEDGGGDDEDNGEAADDQSGKKLDKLEKYRALIQGGDGSDGDDEEDNKDMEVTFNTGLEDISKRILEKKDKKSETVWEAYLRKKSEKRKARKNRSKDSSEDESSDSDREIPDDDDDFFIDESAKKEGKAGKANRKEKQLQKIDNEPEASKAELELLFADDQDAGPNVKGYKIKPRKAKGKKGKDIQSEVNIPVADLSDPRFQPILNSPDFVVDPTDPRYKRSAAYVRQMVQKHKTGIRKESTDQEQIQTGQQSDLQTDDSAPKKDEELQSDMSSKKRKHELSSLVRSLKNKSQQVKVPPIEKDSKKAKRVQETQVIPNNKGDEISSMVQKLKNKSRFLPK